MTMPYVSDQEQTEMISACLSGERQRECNWCSAHHSKPGGRCCFGIRHEYGDRTCSPQECALSTSCASITHSQSRPASNSRIIYPQRPTANPVRVPVRGSAPNAYSGGRAGAPQPLAPYGYGGQYGTAQVANPLTQYGPQLGEPLLVQQPVQPTPLVLNPEDGLFARFFKVSLWGAGEGSLEMALNFFRKRRPE